MANDEDDELKEFGLDGAGRVDGYRAKGVDIPPSAFINDGVMTASDKARLDALPTAIDATDRGIKIDGQRIGTVDLSSAALRQMSKIVNFGLAAGLSSEKILQTEHAREFLTVEEIEEFARRPPRPANATWSFRVGPNKVL
jgi:hypothetical protein